MTTDHAQSDRLLGRTIAGRYTLLTRIGSGGMGVVYLADDANLQRRVAVKLMNTAIADDTARMRFFQEARVIAHLNSPHIVTVFDFGVDGDAGGSPYLVMERLEGAPLHALELPLDWQSGTQIILQVARGLAHAHGRGVCHRDLKPGNIFQCDDDAATIKVLDFGLARDLNRTGPPLTEVGVLTGTVAYLSPEQVMQQPVAAASDVFVLGIVWRELLVGHNDFRADADINTQIRIRDTVPPLVATEVADIPAGVDALLSRMLMKEPPLRPTSAEVVRALEDLLQTSLVSRVSRVSRTATARSTTRPDIPVQAPSVPAGAVAPTGTPAPLDREALLGLAPLVLLCGLTAALVPGVLAATKEPTKSVRAPPSTAPLLAVTAENPPPALVKLGSELFNDVKLSANGAVACATCHPRPTGTTAEGLTRRGFNKSAVGYNTTTILNVAFVDRYTWKGDLDFPAIIRRAMTKETLMGNPSVESALCKGATDPKRARELATQFERAGVSCDEAGLDAAFRAFFRSMRQPVKADGYFETGDVSILNGQSVDGAAARGLRAFTDLGCVACHQGAALGGNMVAKLGVMVDDPYAERGVCDDGSFCRSDADCAVSLADGVQPPGGPCKDKGLAEPRPEDHGVDGAQGFRVPSLRNVEQTAPYFHDGSVRTLEDAIKTMARLQLGRTLASGDVADIRAFLALLNSDDSVWQPGRSSDVSAREVRR